MSKDTASQYICKVKPFLEGRATVSDMDVQLYIQGKKETGTPGYVSNVISAFKAYFRDYRGFRFMDSYRHPSSPLKLKKEIEPETVSAFIDAIEHLTVKTVALLLATSGLRKGEVLGLHDGDVNRKLRCIIPSCHTGETKHSGISFYNAEAERLLLEYEKTCRRDAKSGKLFRIGHQTFIDAWKAAREKTGLQLKPKDLRDFFSQEMGEALIPDRYVDIFQGRAPKGVLARHYTAQGIRLLRKIYDKAHLKIQRKRGF